MNLMNSKEEKKEEKISYSKDENDDKNIIVEIRA